MKVIRRAIVVDASDIEAEWIMGVQLAPNHVPPQWPTADGQQQQQVHASPAGHPFCFGSH